MISRDQIEMAIAEQRNIASRSFDAAASAERDLENYTYHSGREYRPERRAQLLSLFRTADYYAERDAWTLNLMIADMHRVYPKDKPPTHCPTN